MIGDTIADRLENSADKSEKILAEVRAIRQELNEARENELSPEARARIDAALDRLEATQNQADEVNPDAEPSGGDGGEAITPG